MSKSQGEKEIEIEINECVGAKNCESVESQGVKEIEIERNLRERDLKLTES